MAENKPLQPIYVNRDHDVPDGKSRRRLIEENYISKGDALWKKNNNSGFLLEWMISIWVFPKIGVGPQNGWFIMENPIKSIKMDDLGVPLFLETPIFIADLTLL